MKTKMKIVTIVGFILLLAVFACSKQKGTGIMKVNMVDAPYDCDSLKVEIVRIDVHSSEGGWISLPTNAGIYNLLDLQNGISAALVDGFVLPAGDYQQMRLILGSDNHIYFGATELPLELSSQENTGLKLNLNATIEPGDVVDVTFDFVADESVVLEGTGDYKLKPVLKLVNVIYE